MQKIDIPLDFGLSLSDEIALEMEPSIASSISVISDEIQPRESISQISRNRIIFPQRNESKYWKKETFATKMMNLLNPARKNQPLDDEIKLSKRHSFAFFKPKSNTFGKQTLSLDRKKSIINLGSSWNSLFRKKKENPKDELFNEPPGNWAANITVDTANHQSATTKDQMHSTVTSKENMQLIKPKRSKFKKFFGLGDQKTQPYLVREMLGGFARFKSKSFSESTEEALEAVQSKYSLFGLCGSVDRNGGFFKETKNEPQFKDQSNFWKSSKRSTYLSREALKL